MGMFTEQQLGIPTLSIKGVKRGTVLKGVILPHAERNKKTGDVDFLPCKEGFARDKNNQPRLFPSGDPIPNAIFLLQTEMKDWDYTSPEFQEKAANDFPDETDDGKRRFWVESKYTTQAVKAAFKRIKKAPEVGGEFTITVKGIKTGQGSQGDYTYPEIEVDWKPATAEGKAIVARYDVPMPPEPETGMFATQQDDEGDPDL
jgi:hypothetical protein